MIAQEHQQVVGKSDMYLGGLDDLHLGDGNITGLSVLNRGRHDGK